MAYSAAERSFPLAFHSPARRKVIIRLLMSAAPKPAILAATGSASQLMHAEAAQRRETFRPFRELLKRTGAVTWVFAGDSITLGARHTDDRRSYSEHFAERVRGELHRSHDVVINAAADDETAHSLLSDLEWRVLRFRPDVVSVMIGMNDAAAGRARCSQFQENLRHIVKCIWADGALPLLHTPPYIDRRRAPSHADLRFYAKRVRKLARELSVPCVNHWTHWKRTAESGADITGWLAADGLHPAAEGHRALSLFLFRRLGIFDAHSPTCTATAR